MITSGFVHNAHLIRLVPETCIVNCGQILIVHLSGYLNSGNNVFVKNNDFVECRYTPIVKGTSLLELLSTTSDKSSFL